MKGRKQLVSPFYGKVYGSHVKFWLCLKHYSLEKEELFQKILCITICNVYMLDVVG